MQWNDSYKIGIPTIDSQHKRLFELLAELDSALQEEATQEDVERMLEVLNQYKSRHFQLEEKYMTEVNYPQLPTQQEAHAQFSRRLDDLRRQLKEEGFQPELAVSARKELTQWIQEHVTGLDMEFGTFYQQAIR